MTDKRFHAIGGSVYALYPGCDTKVTVRFIVALQTISDYLDNLCDRAGVYDSLPLSQLHLAMLNAVDLESDIADYYATYPYKDDGGYLNKLVEECRACLRELKSYHLIKDHLRTFVSLYSDLQTLKHIAPERREAELSNWSESFLNAYPGISTWEFCAATGSTLAMFLLFTAAFDPDLSKEATDKISDAYFPWVCSLHILLDYYIDYQEDNQNGDFNFTAYYSNLRQCEERLTFFLKKALDCCEGLDYPDFHKTVLYGLIAMYLSDPKALCGMNRLATRNIIKSGDRKVYYYHSICRILRMLKIL